MGTLVGTSLVSVKMSMIAALLFEILMNAFLVYVGTIVDKLLLSTRRDDDERQLGDHLDVGNLCVGVHRAVDKLLLGTANLVICQVVDERYLDVHLDASDRCIGEPRDFDELLLGTVNLDVCQDISKRHVGMR